jgi:DNA-binding NarL/FixJ family response regulator
MTNIRVAIVEDTASVRDGLAAILNASPGFQCVCTCASAEAAFREIPNNPVDVVLMDINLPGRSGIDCVQQLKEQLPGLQIVMLTIEADSQRVFESLAAGATGYLVKNVAPAGILAAIEEVHRGGSPMSSQIARMLVQTFHRQGVVVRKEENLTSREEEILGLIARGYRSKEVAQALAITVATVETHLRNIYGKFHVRSRAGAVARFLQNRTE